MVRTQTPSNWATWLKSSPWFSQSKAERRLWMRTSFSRRRSFSIFLRTKVSRVKVVVSCDMVVSPQGVALLCLQLLFIGKTSSSSCDAQEKPEGWQYKLPGSERERVSMQI